VFGRIGGVSPTVMWSESHLFHAWTEHTRQWSRIYLDVGENERIHQQHIPLDYPEGVGAFYDQLRRAGYGEHELRFVYDPGAGHDEAAWQRRMPDILSWLLA